jgi:hypothetical protein
MKWPFRKKPKPLAIPPYAPPVREVKRESGIEVTEIDTSQMSQTGIHRAWRRMTGQEKDE